MTEPNPGESTLLFVYGTLKKGQRNSRYLENEEFLGPAQTGPGYAFLDAGIFPCLVKDPKNTNPVHGELYRVSRSQIKNLDFHEGAPHFYQRAAIDIVGHEKVEAFFYARRTRWYGKLKDGRWPRAMPWNWLQRLIIAIARNLQHT